MRSYVKLLWPLVIFGHAHLDSRTDSQALCDEYCIMDIPHNTSISFNSETQQQQQQQQQPFYSSLSGWLRGPVV